jgi:selenide,water dikinase
MVPSVLAGRSEARSATIDLQPLARRSGVKLLPGRLEEVDPVRSVVRTQAGDEIAWEVLSVDVGSAVRDPGGLLSDPRVVAVRPLGALVRRVDEFAESAATGRVEPVAAVVGAGAAGVEVAFSLRARLRALPSARVLLVERGPGPLPGASVAARRIVARELARTGVEVVVGSDREVALDERGLVSGGEVVACPALVVLASGASPPPLLARSGLALRDGWMLVDRFLRSVGRPKVLGSGDCIALDGHGPLERSGVLAVRQAPVLAANLRAALGEAAARPVEWTPPAASLALIGTGDGRAIALRGRLAAVGRPWWWLKRRIDSAYVAAHRVATPPGVPPSAV